MKALLLSAGYGTRLYPYTKNNPKCLLKINNKPLLDYWINALFFLGIEEIIINTHYLSKKIEDFVASSRFYKKIKVVNEKELLGTAGTIRANVNYFNNSDFFVAHSDNLCICDFKSFLKAHSARPKQTNITMMTFFSDQPKNCGIIEVDKENILTDFREKPRFPTHNLANAAVYIMDKKVLDFCKNIKSRTADISYDIIPKFIHKIYTWHNTTYNRDIGTLDSYKKAKLEIKKKSSLIRNFGVFK